MNLTTRNFSHCFLTCYHLLSLYTLCISLAACMYHRHRISSSLASRLRCLEHTTRWLDQHFLEEKKFRFYRKVFPSGRLFTFLFLYCRFSVIPHLKSLHLWNMEKVRCIFGKEEKAYMHVHVHCWQASMQSGRRRNRTDGGKGRRKDV